MLCDKRCLPYVTHYTQACQSSGNWRKHAKQQVSFINFKLLEFYWTYFLALQTTRPKVSPKRLMRLDHKPKIRWHTLGFVVILRKYGFLLKKPLVMSVREIIWAVSFNLLLKPDPLLMLMISWGYDLNWWRWNVDHVSAFWSKDLVGHVSQIYEI